MYINIMRNRRKIAIIGMLFLLLSFLIGMGSVAASPPQPSNNSENVPEDSGESFSLPDILGDTYPDAWNPDEHTMIQNMLVSWSNQIYGANAVDGIVDVVSKNPVNMGIWNNWVKPIYEDVMKPIAAAMIAFYFLMELTAKATEERFSYEQLIKMLIKLVAGILLINNALTILETLLNFGTAVVTDMQTSIQSSASSIDNPYIDQVNSMGSGFEDNINAAFTLIKLFFPYILNMIIQLVIMVVCFSRMMELVVRGAFAPIGMADIFAEGSRANGIRYLRKYVSVALQGAVIVGIARTMNMLNLDSGSITSAIVLGFATVMIIIKSQGLCEDLCGAK